MRASVRPAAADGAVLRPETPDDNTVEARVERVATEARIERVASTEAVPVAVGKVALGATVTDGGSEPIG